MIISIRLTPDEDARLDVLAQRTGRSKRFHIRAALNEYLADQEDAFAAEFAIEDFKADGSRGRPLAELKAETER